MAVASARVGAEEIGRPPIRLRALLGLGLLAYAAWSLYPRAIAAWNLHAAASTLANYALCMVGPTGPALLRDNPSAFQALVRRRLISSGAGDRPFTDCAKAAGEITGSVQTERAHRAAAWNFVEYGGAATERAASGVRGLSLEELKVTTRPIAELSQKAWPFSRGGWTRLVKPSMGAHEAIHPVELPKPAVGHGLPAWRSHYRAVAPVEGGHLVAVGQGANLSVHRTRDGGVTFTSAPARGVSEQAERCAAGARSYTLGVSDDGRWWTVSSLGPDGSPFVSGLGLAELEVFAVACDERALVAALKPEGSRDAQLMVCGYRQRCVRLSPPKLHESQTTPRYPLDLARVEGTTIVAVVMHDIVRVASSRDDGRTWTPFSVAFDAHAHPELQTQVKVPGRLLAIGKRVLLYGGGRKPSETYPVLISDDLGASWRRP